MSERVSECGGGLGGESGGKRRRERRMGQEGEQAMSSFFGDSDFVFHSFILNCLLAAGARTAPPRCRTSRAGALFAALPSPEHGCL